MKYHLSTECEKLNKYRKKYWTDTHNKLAEIINVPNTSTDVISAAKVLEQISNALMNDQNELLCEIICGVNAWGKPNNNKTKKAKCKLIYRQNWASIMQPQYRYIWTLIGAAVHWIAGIKRIYKHDKPLEKIKQESNKYKQQQLNHWHTHYTATKEELDIVANKIGTELEDILFSQNDLEQKITQLCLK